MDIGILGCGHIGKVHLQSALVMDDVSVKAVADTVPDNQKQAVKWGVPRAYDDFTELCEEESLDAVVIALPPFLHVEAVRAAAQNGCHAFVEKPFARDVAEAEKMLDLANEMDIHIGVDHTWRYYPHVKEMKRRYEDGRIGHVPATWISRINSGPFGKPPLTEKLSGWKFDPEASGGGVLLSLGVHQFDVLRWFFGELEVTAAQLTRQLETPFEDNATVLAKASDTGTVATVQCGFFQWEDPPDVNMQFRLEGISGTLDGQDFIPENFLVHSAKSAVKNVYRNLVGKDPKYYAPVYFLQAHFEALREFLVAVEQEEKPPVNGRDGIKSIDLVEQAYEISDFDPQTND